MTPVNLTLAAKRKRNIAGKLPHPANAAAAVVAVNQKRTTPNITSLNETIGVKSPTHV
jgi:hypothetical protein